MGNPLCVVDDCTHMGEIDLQFPTRHDAIERQPLHTLICAYHAAMAIDYFESIGVPAPIIVTEKPRRVVQNRAGRPRRFQRYKPQDNTE